LAMRSATRNSILTGSSSLTQPKRFTRRRKWVSTVMPGTPKALPRMTFAVLRPIPGSATSWSSLPGSSPSCRSSRA
jgi:hypothetical protein